MHNNSQVENDRFNAISGVVTDCLHLTIHKAPDPNAGVITTIEALSEVQVDMDESSDNFYKVCTASGIEGFCMKKFIALRK